MRPIVATKYHSLKVGPLCEGCKRCVKGEKLVVFVTGVCPARCFYCPISEEKKQADVKYANERKVSSDEDLLQEARDSRATGAGFTGGDPLARLERTLRWIRLLKKEFGTGFHIHLYTPFNLVTEKRLRELYDAGLDEIRFHPELENTRWWDRILLARKFPWTVGVEIPVLPDKIEPTKKLLEYIDGKIDFLNLNELEISDLNAGFFAKLGYHTKAYDSYGVAGSEEAAWKLMEHVRTKLSYPVHYCTCTLKDRVQMGNRLRRRAENTNLPFDLVDEDGLVTRGAIYANLVPGFGYEKAIENLSDEVHSKEVRELKEILKGLKKMHAVKENVDYAIDLRKPRILVAAKWLKKHANDIGHPCAIVTEYPTWDSFPIEVEFLKDSK